MTDKQIIIDGVDVSGCTHYKTGDCLISPVWCDQFYNCDYKQLKRKEQECEQLKDELSTYGATGICEVCTDKSVLQNDKYTKALIEIKEIAEECYCKCNSMNNCNISCKYYNNCNGEFSYLLAYLNKQISECEVENDR